MRITNRAQRRQDNARLKAKRKTTYWGAQRDGKPLSSKSAGKLLNTAAMCSCWMCGNPRKLQWDSTPHGMTHAEHSDHMFADMMEKEYGSTRDDE